MSEGLPDREARDDSRADVDAATASGPPRALTVLAIVIGALVVLGFILLHLTGAVGPGAH